MLISTLCWPICTFIYSKFTNAWQSSSMFLNAEWSYLSIYIFREGILSGKFVERCCPKFDHTTPKRRTLDINDVVCLEHLFYSCLSTLYSLSIDCKLRRYIINSVKLWFLPLDILWKITYKIWQFRNCGSPGHR